MEDFGSGSFVLFNLSVVFVRSLPLLALSVFFFHDTKFKPDSRVNVWSMSQHQSAPGSDVIDVDSAPLEALGWGPQSAF